MFCKSNVLLLGVFLFQLCFADAQQTSTEAPKQEDQASTDAQVSTNQSSTDMPMPKTDEQLNSTDTPKPNEQTDVSNAKEQNSTEVFKNEDDNSVIGIDERFLEIASSIMELRKQYRSLDLETSVLKKLWDEKNELKQMLKFRLYGSGNTWDVLHAMYGVSKIIVLNKDDAITESLAKLGPAPVPVFENNELEQLFNTQVTDENMEAFFSTEHKPPLSNADERALNCTKDCLVNVSSFDANMTAGFVWDKYCDCLELCNNTDSAYYNFLLNSSISITKQLKEMFGSLDKTPVQLKHCPINDTTNAEKRSLWLKWEEAMLNAEVAGGSQKDFCNVTQSLIQTVFDASARNCGSAELTKLSKALNRHYSGVVLAWNTDGGMISRCPNIYTIRNETLH